MRQDAEAYYVYGITDGALVGYVGVTTLWPLEERLKLHLKDATKDGKLSGPEEAWIREAKAHGVELGIILLDVVQAGEWEEAEQNMISHFSRFLQLTNVAAGGKGQHGTQHTEETKRKIAAGVRRARSKDY